MTSGPEPQSAEEMAQLVEAGAMLLLRSPHLTLSQILELLDISDAEFRRMCRGNSRIAELVEARRRGTLQEQRQEVATCTVCGEWFVPYGGARRCSDECRSIDRIERRRGCRPRAC